MRLANFKRMRNRDQVDVGHASWLGLVCGAHAPLSHMLDEKRVFALMGVATSNINCVNA